MARLRTLGGLELAGSSLPGKRPLLLATYLAVEGGQTRGHLAELFCSNASDPLNQLSVNLSRLRRHLRAAGDAGAMRADAKRVSVTLETDHAKVVQALKLNDVVAAVDSYGGHFLAGEEEHVADELASWILGRREALLGELQRAAVRAAQRIALDGRLAEASSLAASVKELSTAAHSDPLPLAALTELAAGAAPAPNVTVRSTPTNLRPLDTPVSGRERERLELAALLRARGKRLITVLGEGGVGKSALARQVATDQLAGMDFPDGVLLVAAEGRSGAGVWESLATAVAGAGLGDAQSAVALLRDKQVLLVVDDLDDDRGEAGAAAAVVGMLEALRYAKVLVTADRRLRAPAEVVYIVEGLNVPEDGAQRGQDAAADLYLERADAQHHGRVVGANDRAGLRQLARTLGGNPLALTLAARFAAVSSPSELAALFGRDPHALGEFSPLVPGRLRGPAARHRHAIMGLEQAERELLVRLSYFAGSFTHEAAQAVADATALGLVELNDAMLVVPGRDGRLRLATLAGLFARRELADLPDVEAEVALRHAAYQANLPYRHYQAAFSADHAAVQSLLLAELPNTLLAYRYALARRDAETVRGLARGLYALYGRMSWTEAALELVAEGLAALADMNAPGPIGELLAMRSLNLLWSGRPDEATVAAEEALAVLLPANEQWGARNAYLALANAALGRQQVSEGERYFELARSAVPLEYPAAFSSVTGMVKLASGDVDGAIDGLRLAATEHRAHGNGVQEAATRYRLATALVEQAKFGEALREYELVVRLAAGQAPYYVEAAQQGLAQVLARLNEPRQAGD